MAILYSFYCDLCKTQEDRLVDSSERNSQLCGNCGSKKYMRVVLVESSSGNSIVRGINYHKKVPYWFRDQMKQLKKESGSLGKIDI